MASFCFFGQEPFVYFCFLFFAFVFRLCLSSYLCYAAYHCGHRHHLGLGKRSLSGLWVVWGTQTYMTHYLFYRIWSDFCCGPEHNFVKFRIGILVRHLTCYVLVNKFVHVVFKVLPKLGASLTQTSKWIRGLPLA